MPKPGTANTLTKVPEKQTANPFQQNQYAPGATSIAKNVGSTLTANTPASPLTNPLLMGKFPTSALLQQPQVAQPQMSTVQGSGQTSFGTQIPQQQQQTSQIAKVQPQNNALQTAPVQTAQSNPAVAAGGNPAAVQQALQNPQQQQQQIAPPTFTGLVGQLANFQTPTSDMASQQAGQTYGQVQGILNQLKQSRDNQARAIGQQGLAPIPMGDITGRQAVIRQQYETQQGNLANQAQSLSQMYSPALSAAVTGQQQQLSAKQSATTASQPQVGGYGQGYYSPLEYQNQSAMNSAYGKGPAAAANVQSIQELTSQANNWAASRQAAENISGQLQTFLQGNQVNPADFNAVNRFLQTIGAQTSSPQYKQFYNLITDLANAYAPVLSVSGDATNYKTELAQSLLDGTASGQTIPQILASLDAQAEAKINGVLQTRDRLQSGQNINPQQKPYANTAALDWDSI